jgi:hypothetical protein
MATIYGLREWHTPIFPSAELQGRLPKSGWPVLKLRSHEHDINESPLTPWDSGFGLVFWGNLRATG